MRFKEIIKCLLNCKWDLENEEITVKYWKEFVKTIFIADSSYFSTKNLYYLFINKINALIMLKKLFEMYNNELRRKNELQKK